jgi:hypothetical protein
MDPIISLEEEGELRVESNSIAYLLIVTYAIFSSDYKI